MLGTYQEKMVTNKSPAWAERKSPNDPAVVSTAPVAFLQLLLGSKVNALAMAEISIFSQKALLVHPFMVTVIFFPPEKRMGGNR